MEEYRGELLAPAGTMDCLKAAIAAGADAVYLGGQRFGARAFAGNFSREELLEGLSLAHLWNRKIYLTVNTLTKQDELSGLCDWIAPFYEAGLTASSFRIWVFWKSCVKIFPAWSCMPARR